jgi:O-antigen/teichoic acid export membrane protein
VRAEAILLRLISLPLQHAKRYGAWRALALLPAAMTGAADPANPHARSGSLRSILANAAWLLGGRTAAALFSLAYIAILTRTLGPQSFGVFAIIVSIGQGLRALVGFQMWQIIVRYGLADLANGRLGKLVGLIKFALVTEFGGALVGALLAVPAILLLAPRFGWAADLVWPAISFAAVSLLTIRHTPAGILRLYDRFGVSAAAETAVTLVRFLGAIAVGLVQPSLTAFLAVWVIAEIVSMLWYWIAAVRVARQLPWRSAPLAMRRTIADNPGILGFAAITNAAQTFQLIGKQLPIIVVGFFVTPAAAGGFRLASQLGQAMAKVSQLATRAIFPELLRAREFGDSAAVFGRLFRKTLLLSLAASAVLLAVLVFAGKALLVLVAGEAFAFAFPLLLLLGLAAILELAGVAFEPALTAADRAGTAFRIRLVSNVIVVLGLLLLTGRWGAEAAAAIVLAGTAIGLAGMAVASWRVLRRRR